MFKKVFFTLIVFGLVTHQSIFLYGLHNGAADHFIQVWKSFGIIQTEYSAFLFKNFTWFWGFPVICLGFMALSLAYSKRLLTVFAILLALTLDVVLYWSVYSPELMVKL